MSSFISYSRRASKCPPPSNSCSSCMIRTQLNDYNYEDYIIDSARRHAHECDACHHIAKKATLQKWMKRGFGVRISLKSLVA
ncbi:hypothetical protein NEOLEDRAFT_1138795 [Neolentinus lepideus HHB14362 ss-1]|uniref:Uncharacterized protein n=1 Tax=Neolentinus lepideus HHB14362 ss-1 TaxID=1314782 RepID=A0A165Q1Z3_9AGAM|nr:hypothetical protein NEOLEDRAFT_1138795 [Neolentinus lepideus HHB14362 ss-1]